MFPLHPVHLSPPQQPFNMPSLPPCGISSLLHLFTFSVMTPVYDLLAAAICPILYLPGTGGSWGGRAHSFLLQLEENSYLLTSLSSLTAASSVSSFQTTLHSQISCLVPFPTHHFSLSANPSNVYSFTYLFFLFLFLLKYS